ncbi:hypothetical protein PRK78_006839 [Emydomyces testavorans]|uniref:Zn(2)-C6 fungal-type domain-containing protein n=1 Tax=Emydomyces testavorans TaxID=2070801 RepID=A0AAF0IPF3_9EURO|nr:hypothetical protein PRK78_006839 [Emydomyces testavorans]
MDQFRGDWVLKSCASGEEKPTCINCQRQGETCDYSIRLNWEGRAKKKPGDTSQRESPPGREAAAASNSVNRATQGLISPGTTNADCHITATTDTARSRPRSSLKPWEVQQTPDVQIHHGIPTERYRTLTFVSELQSPGAAVSSPPTTRSQSSSNRDTPKSYPSPSFGALSTHDQSILPQARDSPYPSPSDSAISSPGIAPFQSKSGPAPFTYLQNSFSPSPVYQRRALSRNSLHDAKRMRITTQGPPEIEPLTSGLYPPPVSSACEFSHTPGGTVFSPSDSSDTTSDGAYPPPPFHGLRNANSRAALHRVSVQSLLSNPITDRELQDSDLHPTVNRHSGSVRETASNNTSISYGFDCGRCDLDINKNDDSTAIEYTVHPITAEQPVNAWSPATTSSFTDSEQDSRQRLTTVFTKGGYYARPVLINIPRYLTPLPSALLENPINLLYFYHFLNHTSKILVPHDCSNNPFANVLPAMAIQDTNLLNLLLAYSASHRARLLGHAEPYNRIAHWTRDVFPKLRHALVDPNEQISDTMLAAAIMLASLKIISPSTFEVPIPWESYLKLARGLFLARRQMQVKHSSDQVEFFLCRWLGYLDILGSLSSRQTEPPLLGGNYWSTVALNEPANPESDLEIDCFTGFTLECRSLLVRLAELVHECDARQFDSTTGRLLPNWTPPPLLLAQGERLLFDMTATRSQNYHRRTLHGALETGDMAALDDSYRLASIVQLYRRVFCLSPSDLKVVESVNLLIESLDRISRGGTTEVSALLPLFTAGCETQDVVQRRVIRERFKGFEGVGMRQIRRARKLMQRSWKEDSSWTVLAQGEFLG